MKNPFSRSENNRRRIPEEESPEYPGSHSYLRSKRLKILSNGHPVKIICVLFIVELDEERMHCFKN